MESKITLAEAFLILKNKEEELEEKIIARDSAMQNIYKRVNGEKELAHEEHEFSVDELTDAIEKLEKEIRKLRLVVA